MSYIGIMSGWRQDAVTVGKVLNLQDVAVEQTEGAWGKWSVQFVDPINIATMTQLAESESSYLLPLPSAQSLKISEFFKILAGTHSENRNMSSKGPVIVITGTPGTGKSTHGQMLAQESPVPLRHINVGDLVKEKSLYEEYDEEWQSYTVDEDKVRPMYYVPRSDLKFSSFWTNSR